MIQKLEKIAHGKLALIGLTIFILCQIFLASYLIPEIQKLQPEAIDGGALRMIDFQPFSTPEATYNILTMYRPEVVQYVFAMYKTDFIFPLAMVLFFLGVIGKMRRTLQLTANAWRLLLLIPILGLPFDYAENLSGLFMLANLPQRYDLLARITGVFTALKLCFYVLTVATTLALFIWILVNRIKKA